MGFDRYVDDVELGKLEGKSYPRSSSIIYSFIGRKNTFHHIHAVSMRKVPEGPNPLHNWSYKWILLE